MQTDPVAIYIVGAALLGGMIGFFGCCLYCSRVILRVERDKYWEGYAAANRENEVFNDTHLLSPIRAGDIKSCQNQVLADSFLHSSEV